MARLRDYNYFEKPLVSSTSFDIAVSWNFTSTGLALMVQSNDANDAIEYSFDGSTTHGDLVPTYPSSAMVWDNRNISKVWLRRVNAGSAVYVRVEAWRNE